MSVRFCVLGSGSRGNAALLMTPDAHVLIDIGFSPDEIAARLDGTGASWDTLKAVVLTHTHADHLRKRTLVEIAHRGITFYCHAAHLAQLQGGRYFKRLAQQGGVKTYAYEQPFEITPGLNFRPLALPHDCPPTFGFRVESTGSDGRIFKLGYVADLGYECSDLVQHIHDVDMLALEFNHDEDMERNSGRPQRLIERVLGNTGHLSNRQAADVFANILRLANGTGGPQVLVQLHLSAECNQPDLAYRAAQSVVERLGASTKVFTTKQDRRGSVHSIA